MTIEEIRKNAPQGATHYNDTDDIDVVYFRQHQGRWQFFGFLLCFLLKILSHFNSWLFYWLFVSEKAGNIIPYIDCEFLEET